MHVGRLLLQVVGMIDRRQILAAALGTPAVAFLSAAPSLYAGENSASWRALGEAVVRTVGPERAAHLLDAERETVAALPDAADQSSADYRAGRTLKVDGVMISRTEAVLGLLARERAGLRA